MQLERAALPKVESNTPTVIASALKYFAQNSQLKTELAAALMQQDDKLERLLYTLQDVAWLMSPEGKTLYMSSYAETLYGYAPQAFYEDDELWRRVIYPADREAVQTYWDKLHEVGQLNIEYRIVRPDGEVRWLFDRGKLVYGDTGELLRYEGLVSDVTHRKQTELELAASESKHSALLQALPDLLFLYDKNGLCLNHYANRQVAPYAVPDTFIGKPVEAMLPPNVAASVRRHLNEALETGMSTFEYALSSTKGEQYFEVRMVRTAEENVLSLVRDISDIKLAEAQLAQQNAHLSALHEMSLDLMQHHSLQTLLDITLERLNTLVGAPNSFVYLVNKDQTALEMAAWFGQKKGLSDFKIDRGEGIAGQVWIQEEACLVSDYKTWDKRNPDPRYDSLKAIAVLPLKASDSVIGVIGITSHDGEETRQAAFSEAGLAVIAPFAQLVAIAIENARLHDEAQQELRLRIYQQEVMRDSERRYRNLFAQAEQQKQELALLASVRAVISEELELDALLSKIVNALVATFGYDHVGIALIEGDYLVPRMLGGRSIEVPEKVPLDKGIVGYVATTGEPVLIEDVSQDARYYGASDSVVVESELCLPLRASDTVIGVLNIETSMGERLGARDRDLMLHLCQQIAIAIENSLLNAKTKLDLNRTQALYRVSQALTTSNNLSSLLDTASESVLEALGARWVVSYALDTNAAQVQAFSSVAACGTPLEPLNYEDLQASLSGWVLRQGQLTLSPKGQKDARENAVVQTQRIQNDIGSVLVVPLLYEGQRLGTITALKHISEQDFSQDDSDLMMAVANQVATALKQQQLHEQIEHQAYHDALTGLPNRLLFEDRLEQSIARAARSHKPFAVLFVDLDGFKEVNDTLGHHAGDILLQQVAARLGSRVRLSDTLARMGGDEFALILTDLRQAADAQYVAQRYLDLFQKPVDLDGAVVSITASIGVCLYPDHGTTPAALLKNSDIAMYRAKRAGKNDVQCFTSV